MRTIRSRSAPPSPAWSQRSTSSPGDKVEENQVLLIIEAMKMETAITARTAGSVKKVLIKEGQPVKAKELLMELE